MLGASVFVRLKSMCAASYIQRKYVVYVRMHIFGSVAVSTLSESYQSHSCLRAYPCQGREPARHTTLPLTRRLWFGVAFAFVWGEGVFQQ